jgi:hypothetical protein
MKKTDEQHHQTPAGKSQQSENPGRGRQDKFFYFSHIML